MQEAMGPGEPVGEALAEAVRRWRWRRWHGKAVCPLWCAFQVRETVCVCEHMRAWIWAHKQKDEALLQRKLSQGFKVCMSDSSVFTVFFFSFPWTTKQFPWQGPPKHSACNTLPHLTCCLQLPMLSGSTTSSGVPQVLTAVCSPVCPYSWVTTPFTSSCSQPSTPWCSTHYYYILLIDSIFRTASELQKNWADRAESVHIPFSPLHPPVSPIGNISMVHFFLLQLINQYWCVK